MKKFSDYLPRFGRNRYRDEESGPARFEHFIDNARLRKDKPMPRPGVKLVVLVVVIIGLGWGLQRREKVKSLLGTQRARIRLIVPLAVPMGDEVRPEYSSEVIQQQIAAVTPPAQACLLAYPELSRDEAGRVDVEVVLGSGGAVEAAVYGQPVLPQPVARCVGEALGSVRWPQPPWKRKLRFSVVGGSPAQ
jgi:hypothetical protein